MKYLTQTFQRVHDLTAARDLERGCDSLEGPIREGDYVLMKRPPAAVAAEEANRGVEDDAKDPEATKVSSRLVMKFSKKVMRVSRPNATTHVSSCCGMRS